MKRQRVHNEWFRTVSLGGRKSCPSCKTKIQANEHIWSWGEYVNGKWRTVDYCCKSCWSLVVERIKSHTDSCGCSVELQTKGKVKPVWLRMEPITFSEICTKVRRWCQDAIECWDHMDDFGAGHDCGPLAHSFQTRAVQEMLGAYGYNPESFLNELSRRTSDRYVYHSVFSFLTSFVK